MKQQRDKSTKSRILLVDDHPIVREHLGQLINQQDGLMVCGECGEADECLRLLQKVHADLAIVDLSLKTTHGIDLIKDLHLQFPRLPVLVLSMHEEASYAERALRAGARGYVTKQEATKVIMTAIRRVLAGEIFLSEKVAGQVVGLFLHGFKSGDDCSPTARLTDREAQIFELIGRNYQTRQIAEVLKIDVKTVDSHRARIKEKLSIATIEELRLAAEHWVQGMRPPSQNPQ